MEPPRKKLKTEKARDQVFLPSYSKQWPLITQSSVKGKHFAFCKCCNSHFSIRSSGAYDIRTHVEGVNHVKKAEAFNAGAGANMSLKDMFMKSSNSVEESLKEKVMEAEALMCELIAELNLPIACSDTLTKAFKRMFPDSQIAQRFQCARTKTTAVIKELALDQQATLVNRMRNGPFSISTDGSNDNGEKQFPLVVRTIDENLTVHSELWTVPVCHGSATGEAIFKLMDERMKEKSIPWTNCISMGSDNASVMTGKVKGVNAFVRKEHPQIFLSGCTLHLVHIAAEKGSDMLPYSPSELLQDIYYYLNKSSVRQHRLESFQEYYSVEQRKILKHVETRWLSIERCLDRLLLNWDALKAFFKAEQANAGRTSSFTQRRLDRVTETLRSPTARLYMLFLQAASKLFTEFLTHNQSEAPKIQTLRSSFLKLMRDILTKFVKPTAVAYKLATNVDFKTGYNIKDKNDLFIGDAARVFIKESQTLKKERVNEFFGNVVKYYQTVFQYLKDSMPVDEPILVQIEVVDPDRRLEDGMLRKLESLLTKFPALYAHSTKDAIMCSFASYQATDISNSSERIDLRWAQIAKDHPEFSSLAKVMLALLTIPHSSAHCERIFSCVRKNKTDFRASLSASTLEALMVLKHKPGTAMERRHTPALLKTLKGACYRALQS